MVVHGTLLWGSATWHLSTQQEDKLTTTHRRMVRSMLRIRKHPQDSLRDHCIYIQSRITRAFTEYNIEPWVKLLRRNKFAWAGRMVKQGVEFPNRLTAKFHNYFDLDKTYLFARSNGGWQGHTCRFHAWRWESDLFNYFANKKLNWKSEAANTST